MPSGVKLSLALRLSPQTLHQHLELQVSHRTIVGLFPVAYDAQLHFDVTLDKSVNA
jgi:hypothetical protein